MPGYDEISEELLHSARAIIEADNEMQRIKKTKLVCSTKFREKTEQVGRWNIYETRYFRGQSKTKMGVKRLCFSIICILLEVIFIITIVTRLNEYAEIIEFIYKDFEWDLGFGIVRIK